MIYFFIIQHTNIHILFNIPNFLQKSFNQSERIKKIEKNKPSKRCGRDGFLSDGLTIYNCFCFSEAVTSH